MELQKYYLNDLKVNVIEAYGFDTSELSDLWHDDIDESGYYTLDKDEFEWFESLIKAHDLIEQMGDNNQLIYCNDYDDVIDYGLSLKEVEFVK